MVSLAADTGQSPYALLPPMKTTFSSLVVHEYFGTRRDSQKMSATITRPEVYQTHHRLHSIRLCVLGDPRWGAHKLSKENSDEIYYSKLL